MSSPGSRLLQMHAEHQDALRYALTEVAETSFFAFACRCDAELFGEMANAPADEGGPSGDRWVVADVAFDGACEGRLSVAMPEALARDLYVAFIGAEPGSHPEDVAVIEAAGEFVNMVCGRWLTRSCERGPFSLRAPEGTRMPAGWTPLDERTPAEAGDIFALLNDAPLRARLALGSD